MSDISSKPAQRSAFSVRDICYSGLFAAVIAIMAQIESRKDVSCTELIGIAAMVAVEYRADQKRTDSKSKQAHLIGVPAHIVTIQQQIAEHECGLIEHSRLVAAEQNEQGNRSSIDEQSADRAG